MQIFRSEHPVIDAHLNSLQMKFRISRKRREFGAPIFFSDRNVSDVKDGLVECPSFEDDNYSLMKKELDKGIQVCLTEEC